MRVTYNNLPTITAKLLYGIVIVHYTKKYYVYEKSRLQNMYLEKMLIIVFKFFSHVFKKFKAFLNNCSYSIQKIYNMYKKK